MDHSSPIYEESKGIPVLHQQVLYVGNLTPTADGYESTTGYDAGAPLPERQPVNVAVHPDRRAEAKTGDFPNERLHPSKLAADVVAILMPLALLGFMVAISQLEGGEVDRATFSAWENAVTVFATMFPILFASIIGRLVYEVARWRLELGSTMGALEQLLGSRSVGSVVTTQLQLRALNALGLSLLLIWAFSPLGSQSILRVLSSRLEPNVSTSTITYYDNLHETGLGSVFVITPSSQEGADSFFQYLKLLFSATLMTPETIKLDPMDQWGNVKIPFLHTADIDSQRADEEWQEMNQGDSLERYSSVAGIPVANIPFGNTTIFVESTYIELECYNVSKISTMSPDMNVQWDWGPQMIPADVPANGTWQGVTGSNSNNTSGSYPNWSIALNNFINYYWINETTQSYDVDNSPARFIGEEGIQVNPTELLFQAELGIGAHGPIQSVMAFCHVRQRYVESRVSCERDAAARRNCTVTAQRPSRKPHVTELISHLNFPRVWSWLTVKLPAVGVEGYSTRADMIVQYLNDPKLTNITLASTEDMFKHIDNTVFSRRLSQVFNTYLLLSQVFLSAPGGSTGASLLRENVTAHVPTTTLVEVYDVSRLWITLGIASCSVLLVGGLLSVVFRLTAAGPEILGYASTIVRDSKYIDLPPETGRMGGLDITKMMKNQRVKYGFTHLMLEGQRLVGVGLDEETTRIKDRAHASQDQQGRYASIRETKS